MPKEGQVVDCAPVISHTDVPGIHFRKSWSPGFRLDKISKVTNPNFVNQSRALGATSSGGSFLCGAKHF